MCDQGRLVSGGHRGHPWPCACKGDGKNVILSVTVIQQTPTIPGLGLGLGVTSVVNRLLPEHLAVYECDKAGYRASLVYIVSSRPIKVI